MVALKAELFSKHSQVQKAKTDGFKTIRNRPTKKVILKQNSGVEQRAKRDEEQKDEDQPSLEKVALHMLKFSIHMLVYVFFLFLFFNCE